MSLCFTKYHAVLTSALGGDEWLALCSGRFTPGEKATGSYWVGGLFGPQSRSECGDEEKNSLTLPGTEPVA